jgi:hypothetical protein
MWCPLIGNILELKYIPMYAIEKKGGAIMSEKWEDQFRKRMDDFESAKSSGNSVSIKIRVVSGCFHRQHSPEAYRLIDDYLSQNRTLRFEEHESGPEILTWVKFGSEGIALAANVIALVVIIIKARSEGIKKGDRPSEPIELIARRTDGKKKIREEIALRFHAGDLVDQKKIEEAFTKSLQSLFPPKK